MTLAELLAADEFVVTAELGAPLNPDPGPVRASAAALAPVVDAANVTDNQAATVKLSPLACATLLIEEGLAPILQMTTRDRNLLAMQSDLLGAFALGVRNVLALTGDPLKIGPYEQLTRPVADFDSLGLLSLIASLNNGHLAAGEQLSLATDFMILAAANPLIDGVEKLEQKVAAGAWCLQTNIVYDVDRFARWFAPLVDCGLAARVPVIVGVSPPRSTAAVEYLHNNIPGIEVDEATFAKMARLRGADARSAGIEVAVEVIGRLLKVEGVSGVHVMAPGWEDEAVPSVVARAGVGPAARETSRRRTTRGDTVQVIVMDLLAYGENLDYLKGDAKELEWPLPRRYFNPEVAVTTYREHLECWEELEQYGFDGVAVNEHHTSPYGLMNSPNLLAAAIAARTERLAIHIYGNLLPLHDPLRLAEELAMLDCLSNGRIVAGLARGIPREHNVFGVAMSESRARFEEAFEIIRRAWTDEVLNYDGRFWSYHDVAIWPRPLQQPHPRLWVPITSSKETIEWAARHNIAITPGAPPGLREDIISYYEANLERHGHLRTTAHVVNFTDPYVADSKADAVRELAPYRLYFNRTLFSHGNITEANLQQNVGYLSQDALDYVRPENRHLAARARAEYRDLTMEAIERQAEHMPWGTPDEVAKSLIHDADRSGADSVIINLNRGAMPKAAFSKQIRRFGSEVLPALHADEVILPERDGAK